MILYVNYYLHWGGKVLKYLEAITNIFTCIGIFIAIWQLYLSRKATFAEHERIKKQATIELHREMYAQIYEMNHQIYLRYGREEIAYEEIKKDEEFMQMVKTYLNTLEWMSAGVNMEVYDIDVFDRLYGMAMVRVAGQLENYIAQRREDTGEREMYTDYELLVKRLKKIQSKRKPYSINQNARIKYHL